MELKPFTTDGCSGGMSFFYREYKKLKYSFNQLKWSFILYDIEMLKEQPKAEDLLLPWHEDCVEHDYAYWSGGSAEDRKFADQVLRDKVTERGYSFIANCMYYAVRVGGVPWMPLPWRWGFGHKFYKPYDK